MRWMFVLFLTFLVGCGSSTPPAPTPSNCTVVRMVGVQSGFSPNQTTMRAGGCVEFRNDDQSSIHDATFPGKATLNTATLTPGNSKRLVLTVAGTYDYVCSVGNHSSTMRGTIRVQ
jgi:plastocyanin